MVYKILLVYMWFRAFKSSIGAGEDCFDDDCGKNEFCDYSTQICQCEQGFHEAGVGKECWRIHCRYDWDCIKPNEVCRNDNCFRANGFHRSSHGQCDDDGRLSAGMISLIVTSIFIFLFSIGALYTKCRKIRARTNEQSHYKERQRLHLIVGIEMTYGIAICRQ